LKFFEKRGEKIVIIQEREIHEVEVEQAIKRKKYELGNIERNMMYLQKRREDLMQQINKLNSIKEKINTEGVGSTDPAPEPSQSLPVSPLETEK